MDSHPNRIGKAYWFNARWYGSFISHIVYASSSEVRRMVLEAWPIRLPDKARMIAG